ncbi:hypothetical protein BU14_0390s0010 [Porphyra umbilicalis]|uniref:Uncharacterized protein n=1 Tax=Porphyra umbilicalis TaxID=2786 RepID=A0A1X6NX47_PORUM|nr:hypothetical protein BU14_0390s0010 [Porphyra umbilicalis]|eukprot:OSX72973.1 hypothetical protein BU14_0390s0010 [Porphyra umbilicalis]
MSITSASASTERRATREGPGGRPAPSAAARVEGDASSSSSSSSSSSASSSDGKSSSSSSTTCAASTSMASALAAPDDVTANKQVEAASPPAGNTSTSTTRSPALSFIARTPRDVRPVGRSCASLIRKRTPSPPADATITESSVEQRHTQRRRSPSLRWMILRPRPGGDANAASGVRLTYAASVRSKMYSSSRKADTGSSAATLSPAAIAGSSWKSGVPRASRLVRGTLWAGRACAKPASEMTSSPCDVTTMTERLLAMSDRSSTTLDASSPTRISERRARLPARLARAASSSSAMTPTTTDRSASVAVRRAIVADSVVASASRRPRSSAVNRRSCIVSTASACAADRPNGGACSAARAPGASAAPRMAATTLSMRATAAKKPSTTCARSVARAKSCRARARTVSTRKSINASMQARRERRAGARPATSATTLAEKDDCSGVLARRLASTTAGTASRLSSTTTRMPSRSDSSRKSAMPSTLRSLTRRREPGAPTPPAPSALSASCARAAAAAAKPRLSASASVAAAVGAADPSGGGERPSSSTLPMSPPPSLPGTLAPPGPAAGWPSSTAIRGAAPRRVAARARRQPWRPPRGGLADGRAPLSQLHAWAGDTDGAAGEAGAATGVPTNASAMVAVGTCRLCKASRSPGTRHSGG